ncbi:MAG: choloylglycine hydrolase family protein [Anaerofustis stercorihominis]|nr:choloylglycine hydrolase family protein [Anaerofustis stercorihominis]
MCTAATYKTNDFYFGRTLDNGFSYGEEVVITPRNYMFDFRHYGKIGTHYAIIGMAHIAEGYPLYYDAINEKGLCIAGLNFVGNAHYNTPQEGMDNIAQFEFVPWILSLYETVAQVRDALENTNITDTAFSEKFPPSQLHWIISDKDQSITVECVKEGLKIYDNPAGVLANNPSFDMQMFNLNNYMNLTAKTPISRFAEGIDLSRYSLGMGAIGLPGDLSSMSRFVRVAFTKMNSVSGDGEMESVSQFFHILGSVDQQRGCCELEDHGYEITVYTSCCNASKGIYYYTTYDNHRINGISMHRENLDGSKLISFRLNTAEDINMQN